MKKRRTSPKILYNSPNYNFLCRPITFFTCYEIDVIFFVRDISVFIQEIITQKRRHNLHDIFFSVPLLQNDFFRVITFFISVISFFIPVITFFISDIFYSELVCSNYNWQLAIIFFSSRNFFIRIYIFQVITYTILGKQL